MKLDISPRWFVLLLFILLMLFCSVLIWNWQQEDASDRNYITHLRMVNVLSRHGDRSPGDSLPLGDKHAQAVKLFWPNGLTNLTDAGRFRQFRVGLELRKRYSQYLGFDSSRILALSSPLYRCIESLQWTLRGLYDLDWTKDRGIAAALKHDVPNGSGSAIEWKSVLINTTFIPSLFYEYLNNCSYRIANPSPIDKDLSTSEDISSLVGLEQLEDILMKRYRQPLNFFSLGLWSTIVSELNLVRTKSTIDYTDHYSDWINLIVSKEEDLAITLFDLYEQIAVFGYRDRIIGDANYIQSGPILTSIIESQLVGLTGVISNERMKAYKGKRMILYSSHDSILQLILHTLKVIDVDGPSFEDRFYHWSKSGDDLLKFLAGFKMSSYGFSMKFELFEMETRSRPGDSFAYVKLSIYNQEDGKSAPVDYRPVPLGEACKRMFLSKYSYLDEEDLDYSDFYDPNYRIDRTYACPFDLFRNVTADFMINDEKLNKLCN